MRLVLARYDPAQQLLEVVPEGGRLLAARVWACVADGGHGTRLEERPDLRAERRGSGPHDRLGLGPPRGRHEACHLEGARARRVVEAAGHQPRVHLGRLEQREPFGERAPVIERDHGTHLEARGLGRTPRAAARELARHGRHRQAPHLSRGMTLDPVRGAHQLLRAPFEAGVAGALDLLGEAAPQLGRTPRRRLRCVGHDAPSPVDPPDDRGLRPRRADVEEQRELGRRARLGHRPIPSQSTRRNAIRSTRSTRRERRR